MTGAFFPEDDLRLTLRTLDRFTNRPEVDLTRRGLDTRMTRLIVAIYSLSFLFQRRCRTVDSDSHGSYDSPYSKIRNGQDHGVGCARGYEWGFLFGRKRLVLKIEVGKATRQRSRG